MGLFVSDDDAQHATEASYLFHACLGRRQGRGDKGLLRSCTLTRRRETETRSVLRVAFSYELNLLSWNSCPRSLPPFRCALPPRALIGKEVAVEAEAVIEGRQVYSSKMDYSEAGFHRDVIHPSVWIVFEYEC